MPGGEEGYEEITCKYLLDKMKKDPSVVADYLRYTWGYGLYQEQTRRSREAVCGCWHWEETAVALASGIAGKRRQAFLWGYSTFVQRAFDQISQDLCINNNPATIVTFLGSVYGMNDVTHLSCRIFPCWGTSRIWFTLRL